MSQLSTPNDAPRFISANPGDPPEVSFADSSPAHDSSLKLKQQIRKAVLVSISGAIPPESPIRLPDAFLQLSPRDWKRLLHWLDVSGLALYFLDNVISRGWRDTLPPAVVDRLQQNLEDNGRRTRGMIEESVAIQQQFQSARITYAVMKGISLSPFSVPRPELRHQFDLDYLVAEPDAPLARGILERRGYHLRAINGATWEYKIHETPHVSLRDLYKDLPYRGVELHLESSAAQATSRLARTQQRDLYGISMPVLSPVDIFLGQAMHAYKDLCSGFCRASQLLEFHRHVRMRYSDEEFWRELRTCTEDQQRGRTAIGVVTLLLTSIFGHFAPPEVTESYVDQLPSTAHLWVALYGHRVVLGDPPGTKLYLFLQEALSFTDNTAARPTTRSLLPSRLPRRVIQPIGRESLATRLARYRVEARFVFTRLWFHISETTRYARELPRWRRRVNRLSL